MAASNYYPIVSSSPPPLLDPPNAQLGAVEEDDGFDFTRHLEQDDHQQLKLTNSSSKEVASEGIDESEDEEEEHSTNGLTEGGIEDSDSVSNSGVCSSSQLEDEVSPDSQSKLEDEQTFDPSVCIDETLNREQIEERKDSTVVSGEYDGGVVHVAAEEMSDDDDFGDFDAFRGSVDHPIEENAFSVLIGTEESALERQNETEQDEFTDFRNAAFETVASDDFASFEKAESFDVSCDWAEEGGARPICDELATEEDDEFGDFDCARATDETSSRCEAVDGFDRALTSAFPPFLSLEARNETSETNSELDIWSDLCDVDTTNALTYQWSSSHSNKMLVLALRINSRNVQLPGTGWSSLVPAFASTLTTSPLEPTKALVVSNDVEDRMSSAATAKQVDSVDLSFIPQAEFDWSGSGLTNPLEDDTASALLDLDFFLTNDAPNFDSPPPIDSLESELLDPRNRKDDGRHLAPLAAGQQPSPILRKILLDCARSTTMMQSQTTKNRPLGLTDEAKRILDSLPDLSFLRAKVLMFPIRSLAP